ncbi:uncharacterized protein LOC132165234 [Corylus avellana]|uniref:uncharacterized protein LOC132165234 n=1 Tax=Corylus avellana TaxID=13451 RepID=UPI00286B5935|nr:uncharacterized protein LOC132165234 [Corylus avellana]
MNVWGYGRNKVSKEHFYWAGVLAGGEGMFSKCNSEEMALFVGLARRIWLRQNDILHEGTFSHPQAISLQVKQAVEDFKKAQMEGDDDMLVREHQRSNYWMAPSLGWFKANWDASFDNKASRMGLGVVIICDQNGGLFAARCGVRMGSLSPARAETMAALLAIRQCKELGLTHVHVEGDAKSIIDAVNCELAK